MTSKKLNIYNIKAGCRYVYPKLTIYNISEKSIYRGELPERAEAHHSWTVDTLWPPTDHIELD